MRVKLQLYLEDEGLQHGRIANEPSWLVAPYVSIWTIESNKTPGNIGWWAICGDLPTDYISSNDAKNPRQVLNAISKRWLEVADYMQQGKSHPSMELGNPKTWPDLAPLLKSRAETLGKWASDNSLWEEAL